jgi:hypothetical protein
MSTACSTCKLRVERIQKEITDLRGQWHSECGGFDRANVEFRDLLSHMWRLDPTSNLVPLQQAHIQMGELLKKMEEGRQGPKAITCLIQEAGDRVAWAQALAKNCTHTEPTVQVVHYVH